MQNNTEFKPDQYAMYLRKSRADVEAEKLGEGETLKKHREILTALAVRRNLYVSEIFEEIVSGETIEARPQIQKMIRECYEGRFKGIIVIDVDRLSRGNQANMQTIMDCLRYSNDNNGLLVVTPTKTYDVAHNHDDEEYMEFVLFMSRREYKTIQKRLQRGRNQSIVEGNYMGSYRPYGYDIVKAKYSRTLTPNPEEAPIVQKMFEWCVSENISANKIAKRLNLLGVPTYRVTTEWVGSTVKDILTNPIYIGKVRWNDRMQVKRMIDGEIISSRPRNTHGSNYMEYDGKHPAIIDEETFYAARSRFKIDKTKSGFELKNALAGLIFCSKCGRALIYQSNLSKKNTKSRFIHTTETKCQVKSVVYDDVISAVVKALQESLENLELDYNSAQANEQEIKSSQEHLEELREAVKKKEKILDKLFKAWEDGILSDSEFVQRKQVCMHDIEDINAEISTLDVPEVEREYESRIIMLSDALEYLKDADIDAKPKNEFLKAIIERIDFSRDSGKEFILDIYLI